jgi:hypothetical protein
MSDLGPRDDSTTYYFTSHVAWLSRWADSCTIFVVVVDLITHTKGNLLCSPGIVWDCCKFLVLNDLRNSCPGIEGIVASFLSWLIWGIHVVMIVVLLHVFHCYFVLCYIGTVLGFPSGIIDGIIYLPLTQQILSSFPTTLLHFPTPQVLALKTYTWFACLEVCNWSFNSFGQVKIQHYSNSLMLPPCSLSEWMKLFVVSN